MFKFFLNIIFKAVFRTSKLFFIPFCVGFISFAFLHNIIDTNLWLRVPYSVDQPINYYLTKFFEIALPWVNLTNNKFIFLHFIIFWILLLGIVGHFSPILLIIMWGLLFCIIEFLVIRYFCRADWQTTMFSLLGWSVERVVDFEDLRISFENLCLTHYCIEPGMNPCKMARDCLNGHNEGKLLQDVFFHVWDTTQDYDSWAGAAGKYVDKIGPRYTKFSEWYWWYDVWPDPETLPKEPVPENMYNEDPFWKYSLALGAGCGVMLGFTGLILYAFF